MHKQDRVDMVLVVVHILEYNPNPKYELYGYLYFEMP